MIIKDLLNSVNIDKQVKITCDRCPSYREPYDPAIVRAKLTDFVNMLKTLTPIESDDHIIIFEKYWEHDDHDKTHPEVSGELYHTPDVINYINTNRKVRVSRKLSKIDLERFDNKLTLEQVRECCNTFPLFPVAYGYEYCDWEEILGYKVYEGNLKQFNIQDCIYAVLFEMSYNGFTREDQMRRRAELDEAINSEKVVVESLDDLLDDDDEDDGLFNNNSEEDTKEVIDFDRIYVLDYYCSLKSSLWRFKNFKSINPSKLE